MGEQQLSADYGTTPPLESVPKSHVSEFRDQSDEIEVDKGNVKNTAENQNRSNQDRFNKAVNNQLDREFERSHDVSGLYFTHAFPSANLENIIHHGGLKTPAKLEKEGTVFATGSDATVRGQIFFAKGKFYTGYSTHKEGRTGQGGCGILVPQAEFHRLRRFWKNTEGLRFGHVGKEEDYMDPDKYRGGEHSIISESNESGDPTFDTSRKFADALKKKKLDEAALVYEQKRNQLSADFERVMSELAIEDFPKDAKTVLSFTEQSRQHQEIPLRMKHHEGVIAEAQKRRKDLEAKIAEEENFARIRERHAVQKIALLEPSGFNKFLEKLGIGKAEREQKIQDIKDQLVNSRADLDMYKSQQSAEDTTIENARSQIRMLELYRKLCGEFFELLGKAKKEMEAEKNSIEDKYRTDTQYGRSPIGSRVGPLRDRLRKRDQTEDTEDKFRVGLARSVILIDSGKLTDALKATEQKPDLRSRILIYDPAVIRREYNERYREMNPDFNGGGYVVPDALNAFQQILSRTKDGLVILKKAQRGLPMEESFQINGVRRLDEYVQEQQVNKAT